MYVHRLECIELKPQWNCVRCYEKQKFPSFSASTSACPNRQKAQKKEMFKNNYFKIRLGRRKQA